MKTLKSIRINANLTQQLDDLAKAKGISFSRIVELACYLLLDEEPVVQTREDNKLPNDHWVDVRIFTNSDNYLKLLKVCKAKNSTLSREIRYRLNASFDNTAFSQADLDRLNLINNNLANLGNLLRLTIRSNLPVNDEFLKKLQDDVRELKAEFVNVLDENHSRFM
ncbi:hypothetical protein [Gallibacterium anatis]|uniref:hypothetical protein n=1 Tax=Gallibacterium anatis TaxID=750 RepID=UPI0030066A93